MFFKVFLVLSCLVLYTTSMPSVKRNQYHSTMGELKDVLSTINCDRQYLHDISYTYANKNQMCEEIPVKFCEIHKAVKNCSGTDRGTTEFRNLVDQVKGNVTCILPEENFTNTDNFFDQLKKYLSSLSDTC